eukprot:861618-Pyramimonas_sp.AAC.1
MRAADSNWPSAHESAARGSAQLWTLDLRSATGWLAVAQRVHRLRAWGCQPLRHVKVRFPSCSGNIPTPRSELARQC